MVSNDLGSLLHISGLTKRYGVVTAVWNVDLDVYPGDFVTIFGPNGAGKTTLLRLVAQLAKPTLGEIEYRHGSGQRRDAVGYLSHQSLLYGDLTGFENLVFFSRLYGVSDPEKRASELIDRMGLGIAQHQFTRGYSSGMKQRLKIARALLHGPQLVLLDEPYAGLDQHGCRLLTVLLKRLRTEGRTILLITHNLREGLDVSTRVVVMNHGQIVHNAPREEIEVDSFDKLYFRLVEN
ncbi:MAG TPA: ABC transporter ATP-binding protein [Acidobacteriota bacterium]|nr:ABC transporter ATP-binding protein [Acidobacteriota bacterium]